MKDMLRRIQGIRRERDKDLTMIKHTEMKAFVLCLSTVVFLSANIKISVNATGAGIQLGTDIAEEVVPHPDQNNGIAQDDLNADSTQNINTENGEVAEAQTAEDDNSLSQTEDELNGDSNVAYIEVKEYSIDDGLLEPGSDITIDLTIHNVSSMARAESLVMTVSSDSGMIYPKYGTDNQIFVGTVLPDETKTISIPVTVSNKFEGDAADFTCSFNYISLDRQISNSSTMVITSSSGKSLVVKSLDISTHAILNGKSLLNINYSNKSNGNITDAELLIEGNVSDDSKKIKLDTAYAGKSYNKDYNVTFIEAGTQDVKVKLVYTDITGERMQTDLGSFNIIVSPEATSATVSKTNTILLWCGRALAGIAFVIALFTVFLHLKKR